MADQHYKKRKVQAQLGSEATLSEDGHSARATVDDDEEGPPMSEDQRLEAKRAYNRMNSARARKVSQKSDRCALVCSCHLQ